MNEFGVIQWIGRWIRPVENIEEVIMVPEVRTVTASNASPLELQMLFALGQLRHHQLHREDSGYRSSITEWFIKD